MSYFLLSQDTIRNPSVMDFIDRSLEDVPFSSKHILNFLHNGPPEDRGADMPDFDWRDIFNLTDRVIRMLNQYGDVSGPTHLSLWYFLHLVLNRITCMSKTTDWILENVYQHAELN